MHKIDWVKEQVYLNKFQENLSSFSIRIIEY